MIVKTKKYQLEKNTYIKIALINVLKEQWWAFLIAAAICGLSFLSWWFMFVGILGAVLFVAFWAIQFAGITQVEQYKVLFEKYSYEIDSRQILIKVNEKQGMQIKWEQVQKVQKDAQAYILYVSKGQFVYLPYKIFNSDNDLKFFEALLRRKSFADPIE